MSSIMGQIEPEHPELFALEFEKLLNMTLFTLSSTNIDQSAPNLVKMYVIIRSRMSSIMNLIGPELSLNLTPVKLVLRERTDFPENTSQVPCLLSSLFIRTEREY